MRISDWSSDVCSSDLLPKVPKHLVVIGGGVIGLELGSVWRRLGAKVTVVEFLDQILPGMDGEVRKEAAKLFKKQGFEIKLGTKVTGATVKGGKASLTVEPAKGGAAETIEADRSEEHTSELQSLMRSSYAVFCLKKKKK